MGTFGTSVHFTKLLSLTHNVSSHDQNSNTGYHRCEPSPPPLSSLYIPDHLPPYIHLLERVEAIEDNFMIAANLGNIPGNFG